MLLSQRCVLLGDAVSGLMQRCHLITSLWPSQDVGGTLFIIFVNIDYLILGL